MQSNQYRSIFRSIPAFLEKGVFEVGFDGCIACMLEEAIAGIGGSQGEGGIVS